jgi:hypothetical protein
VTYRDVKKMIKKIELFQDVGVIFKRNFKRVRLYDFINGFQ